MKSVWKTIALAVFVALAMASCGTGETTTAETSLVTLPGGETSVAPSETTAAADNSEAPAETPSTETPSTETTTGSASSETTDSSTDSSATETTAEATTTDTSAPASSETSETTESTVAEAEGPAGALGLKIVSINFDTAEVQVTNGGTAAVDLSSYTWCNFPAYNSVSGGGVVEPGATVTLTSSVAVTPAAGELGLYRTSDFADSTAIAAYVEWGTPDHERAPVAIAAGIWSGEPAVVDGSTLTNN